MSLTIGRYGRHVLQSAQTALIGPQILAFVPAVTLGGYWFGGEGVLLFMAIVLPALLGIAGLFAPVQTAVRHRGPVDATTRLPLREALIAALDTAFCAEPDTGLRSAALVLEIDDFESIKADFEQGAIDRILTQIAERVTAVMRESDIVSRLNGSVFAFALSPVRRADLESLVQISARLQTAVAEPILLDGLRLHLTASVGFCIPRRPSEKTGYVCLEAAEVALSEAKASGTAAIRAYSGQPGRKPATRSGLVGEVADALESGQIRPWFQPQLSTETAQVSGIETLARWEHPERGIILPGVFLPAISAAGMSSQLGEVMLYGALSTLKKWDAGDLHVPTIGVNFNNDELVDPRLCDRIRWELDRFDLAPHRLTVEVLETVIARSANDTITRNIAQLAEMGCGIDLDDFGTGHASIASIRRFAVKRIKIDRSFITRIDSDREQQQMLSAILEMAERLGVDTLAEGVESAGEHTLLSQLGCGHVQGYSIAEPMPADVAGAWIEENRKNRADHPRITRKTG